MLVRELMIPKPAVVTPETTLPEALKLMQEKKDPKVADAAALPKANDDDKNQDFQDISTEPAMEMK